MTAMTEQRKIDEAYGELRANMHLTVYAFERGAKLMIWLLQENRWKQCGAGFKHVDAFVESLRMDDFKFVTEVRKKIAVLIKAAQPKISNRKIAKAVGVSHTQIDTDLGKNLPRHSKNASKVKGGNGNNLPLSGAQAARLVANREAKNDRTQQASARRAEQTIAGPGSAKIIHGDFRGKLADLKDVDAIITDPPYGKEFLPLLRDLAGWADKVLKSDGIMAVLYGQTYLPEAFNMLSGFRPYRWTACYLTPGEAYTSHARSLICHWKPLLIYGGNEPRFDDVFESPGDEDGKVHHEWGQSFEAFQTIIERLTKPGQLIADPFAGGGTTLFAAKTLGRDSIGCEINPEHVKTIQSILDREKENVAA